jgi:hypothetical protein
VKAIEWREECFQWFRLDPSLAIDLHPQAGVGKSFNCVFRVKEVVEAGAHWQAAGRYG